MRYFLRVVKSTMKATMISQWRFFSWTGFALRFFPPLLNLGVAWVLYSVMFDGQTSVDFMVATNSSDYFSFVLVGSVFFVYVTSSLFSVGRAMFWERAHGTIEALFLSPMNYLAYMLGVAIAAFNRATIDLAILVLIGYILGFRVQHANITLLATGCVSMLSALFGLSLIINAITLTLRDRTNTANTLSILLLIFSGIVCPIKLMPGWAQVVSKTLPFSYGINILRAGLISGSEAIDVSRHIIYMMLLLSVYIIVGITLMSRVIRNSKKKATLSFI